MFTRPAVRGTLLITIIAILGIATVARGEIYAPEVTDLGDRDVLFESMRKSGAEELPIEAVAAYQAAMDALDAGRRDDAIRWLELAADLDPALPEAHLALARLHLPGKPRRALENLSGAVHAALATFTAQHLWMANAVFGILILIAALHLVLVLYAVLQHIPKVHHSTRESFALWFPGSLAGLLAASILLSPAFWRIGLLPLAMSAMGITWHWMRSGERRWTGTLAVGVVAAPILLWALSPLLLGPLDPSSRAFLLDRAMRAPYSEGLVEALETAREANPEDPNLHYALAMVHTRGGRYTRAENEYHRAFELGAPPDRVLNNLGVVAFLSGDYDRALDTLQRSIDQNPERASSRFNLSQTFAKKLYFEKAEQELAEANRLDMGRIRAAIRYSGGNAARAIIDEPLPDRAFWAAAWAGPRRMPGVPGWMQVWFGGSLWLLSAIGIVSFAVTYALGRRLHQSLPSIGCANCARPICRRCLRRVRRRTYCAPCGDVLLRIQSSSYSKLVLDSQIRRKRRLVFLVNRIQAWFFPGLHAIRIGRPHLGGWLTLLTTLSAIALILGTVSVHRMVWIDAGRGLWWPALPGSGLGLAFLLTWWSVTRLKERSEESRKMNYTVPVEDEEPLDDDVAAA